MFFVQKYISKICFFFFFKLCFLGTTHVLLREEKTHFDQTIHFDKFYQILFDICFLQYRLIDVLKREKKYILMLGVFKKRNTF